MANLFSAITLILSMTAVPACFVAAAPVRIGRQTDISEPQARKTLREGLIVLSNAASTIPRFPNTEGLTSLCDVLNYTQKLVQVQSTEPATAVTALVAKQVHRDACQWLKTVSNGLVRTCSESELAFFCTQLTLNLRNSARTTTQAGLPSSPADICEWIKNHFAMGSPERERLYNTTDC